MARIESSIGRRARRRAGFTLIELLAAMTILVFIILMMTRLFSDATSAWTLGAKRITTATEGRAVMDFMVNELTQAVADDMLTFKLSSSVNFGVGAYGAESDELYFGAVVQSGTGGNKRNLDQFAYFIAPMLDEQENVLPNRYRLVRTRRTASMYTSQVNRDNSIYKRKDWWVRMNPRAGYIEEADPNGNGQGSETIAENIAAFEVWAWSEANDSYVPDYDSRDHDDMLPLWVDIYLEMLSEEDAERMSILWPVDQQAALDFLAANVKRFTTRVFFPNRERALAFKP
jgi:prepilin-type N-terminal cleavage/methylation domain-containing protein